MTNSKNRSLCMLIFFIFAATSVTAKTLTIGVFAYQAPEKIIQEYKPIADHLSKKLNTTVVVKPLEQSQLEQQVSNGLIDIVATNPTHYLSLQKKGKTTGAIVTLVKRNGNLFSSMLGGVIITRANRTDIRKMKDLIGKTVAIPGKKFLGGYQTQVYELLKNGINVEKDLVTKVTGSHSKVVDAVISGSVDAGFIRSGIIEEMTEDHKLNPKALFVLNEQSISHFPIKVSTRLYPEWAIVAARKLDVQTVSKIAVALYEYENFQTGNNIINGFSIPGDYAEIDALARKLRIAPYEKAPDFTGEDIWNKYGLSIIVFASTTTLFLIVLGVFYNRNRFEKRYAQAILNSSPSPTIITDGNGLVGANIAFLTFVGYTSLKEFKSKHNCISDIFNEGDTDDFLQIKMNDNTWVKHILSYPEREWKAKITINNKTTFFQVNASAVEYGNLFRAVVIFNDVTMLINQSHMDTLTQIPNRMNFDLMYEHALNVTQREKTPLSLIFFDIDHFKAVNDTYGHLEGDSILSKIAHLVKSNLRKSDIIARWGGEEFIILLQNTSIKSASLLAESLRTKIEKESFSPLNHLTCSFGVAQLQDEENGSEFLQRVDKLLYKAKNNGRNRVEVG